MAGGVAAACFAVTGGEKPGRLREEKSMTKNVSKYGSRA